MPPQLDLPEPMAWRAMGSMEAGQTQQEVAQAIGVSQNLISRLWNSFKEQVLFTEDQNKVNYGQ